MKLKDQGFDIGDLHIEIPIIQGGMGVGISGSGLASAVAAQGGVGVISAAGVSMLDSTYVGRAMKAAAQALQAEIKKARELSNGVLGVNIMVALTNFEEMARAAVEAGVDIIFSGAGLPLNLPKVRDQGSKTKLVPIVSSAKAASTITKWWVEKHNYIPDAFVLEGPMAGGHLGFKPEQIDDPAFALQSLVTPMVELAAKLKSQYGKTVPIIAGGGVFTGEDIKEILDLGASGVQMATRFVATHEADCDLAFKEAYVNCKEDDIGIIESPVGMPGRALINSFVEEARMGKRHPKGCPYHCIVTCQKENSPYCISLALINACRGKLNNGFIFIGKNGHRVDKIVSVKELIEELDAQYSSACQQAAIEHSTAARQIGATYA